MYGCIFDGRWMYLQPCIHALAAMPYIYLPCIKASQNVQQWNCGRYLYLLDCTDIIWFKYIFKQMLDTSMQVALWFLSRANINKGVKKKNEVWIWVHFSRKFYDIVYKFNATSVSLILQLLPFLYASHILQHFIFLLFIVNI